MNENSKSLNDVMKIYRIRKKNAGTDKPENRNFEEFKRVYRGASINKYVNPSISTISDKYIDEFKSTVLQKYVKESMSSQSQKKCVERKAGRPVKDIKTVRLEWPLLGTEGAICQPNKRNRLSTNQNANPPAQAHSKQILNSTKRITENWKGMEETKMKEDVRSSKHSRVTVSNEYNPKSMEQGDKSSDLLNLSEKSRKRPKSATYKPKSKQDRHHDCVNRKYMATLTTIKQKLQRLDEKYFGKPQIVYKNVRDIFTQPSAVEVEKQNSEDVKIEEVFRGIKKDLDAIANPKLEEEQGYSSTNWLFRKPAGSGELNRNKHLSYSAIIDQSEARLKKMRIVKQHIVDVEEFCDKLCNIGEEDDDEEEPQKSTVIHNMPEKRTVMSGDVGKGIFDDTELQKSVSRSAYLMKEFKIDPSLPTIKVFSDSNSFIRNTSQFLEAGESSTKKRDHSITSLIEHLNAALNNSIYKPV